MTWNKESCGHTLYLFYRTGNPDYVRPTLISADKEEVNFILTGIASNGGNRFWPEVNGLKWSKLVLTLMEWLVLEDMGFGLTKGSWFYPAVVLACLKSLGIENAAFIRLGMDEISFCLTRMA
jgi:hypothetical protein